MLYALDDVRNDEGTSGSRFVDLLQRAVTTEPGPLTLAEQPWLSGFHEFKGIVDLNEYFGYGQKSVNQTVTAGGTSETFELVVGKIDATDARRSLDSCDECVAPMDETYRGQAYWVWGGENEIDQSRSLEPPVFDQFGRGGRVVVLDGSIYRVQTDESVASVIDLNLGLIESLAQDPDFGVAADELAELGVANAVITTEDFSASTLARNSQQARVDLSDGLLVPFRLAAFGSGFANGKNFTGMVLIHDSAEIADENSSRLQERLESGRATPNSAWTDIVTDFDISVAGNVLIARLTHPTSLVLNQSPNQLPVLLAYE